MKRLVEACLESGARHFRSCGTDTANINGMWHAEVLTAVCKALKIEFWISEIRAQKIQHYKLFHGLQSALTVWHNQIERRDSAWLNKRSLLAAAHVSKHSLFKCVLKIIALEECRNGWNTLHLVKKFMVANWALTAFHAE